MSSASDRLVVVTGGASGIGLACAERFREDGAHVVVLDLAGGDVTVDITDRAGVRAAFARLGNVVESQSSVAVAGFEHFVGMLSNPAIAEPLLADERQFIDHGRSVLVLGAAPA